VPLFDTYVMVDWSARAKPTPAKPSKDAIWVGVLDREGSPEETYHRTREAATASVRARLVERVLGRRRVLVGFDFPYGYPRGLAAALGLAADVPPWRSLWDLLSGEIEDHPNNASNRFRAAARMNARIGPGPGPFWGCSAAAAGPDLTTTRPYAYPYAADGHLLARLRSTEAALLAKKLQVQETWKLAGNGCVGSQALVGIPRVSSLRLDPDLAGVSRVWPFETGLTTTPVPASGPYVLHAEIWPGIVDPDELAHEMSAPGMIRDRAQVRLICRWAAERDSAGTLGRWFGPEVVGGADHAVVVAEEGWILGCEAGP
jgi:hypothetical protein